MQGVERYERGRCTDQAANQDRLHNRAVHQHARIRFVGLCRRGQGGRDEQIGIHAQRARAFAELGPGGVLTGMTKRTLTDARTISVQSPEDLDKFLEFVAGKRYGRDLIWVEAIGPLELA